MKEIEICKIMFEEKAKEIVKDILKSVRKEDDPVSILLEVYMVKRLNEAYKLGFEDYKRNENHF